MLRKLSHRFPDAALDRTAATHRGLARLVESAKEVTTQLQGITRELLSSPGGNGCTFSADLNLNEQLLHSVFSGCGDVKKRHFRAAGRRGILYFIEGMSDLERIETNILRLLEAKQAIESHQQLLEILPAPLLEFTTDASSAARDVMQGSSLIVMDGFEAAAVLGTIRVAKRDITEARRESALRGPLDAFNETLDDNVAVIRRRTSDVNAKLRYFTVGERAKNQVALIYIEHLIKAAIVDEVSARLRNISTDRLLSAGSLEEQLSEYPWSPFPYLQVTERPDKVVSALYDGRFALIIDNTPWVLIGPSNFQQLLQTTDDYTVTPVVASLIRLTRYIAAVLAVLLPGFYVAVVSFQPGVLPTSLALTIAELRARAPFPAFLEAFVMEALLELFQEAVTRLPEKVVVAASVVGGFVIGSTVVEAGIINPLLVVVMAITAICSYIVPSYALSLSLRWLRIPILLLASTFGLFGVGIGSLFVITHMAALENFGESFLGGLFDTTMLQDWKDNFVRLPANFLRIRPKVFGAQDRSRSGGNTDG
ncbi:MAG TPA: spore germination protein [Selenomonadales bacterium]|nr:spore germination protein [Selenomonadales bacterium]